MEPFTAGARPDGHAELGYLRSRSTSPRVSILIAAYNGAATLPRALDSLLVQTSSDWEAIVVDDGSTDGTAALVSEYARRDGRIRVFSKLNGGTSTARNAAARLAAAPLLALLDQDDWYLPEYVEAMCRFVAQYPDFDIYSCNAYYLFEDGHRERRDPPGSPIRSYSLEQMLEGCCIHPQAVFRRVLFDTLGGFDENPRCWTEDYDFWLRAMVAGARHVCTPELLAVYAWNDGQKSSSQLACVDSDVYILAKLVENGGLRGPELRTARRSLRRRRDELDMLLNHYRVQLESQLVRGQYRGARKLYLRSRKEWASRAKYWAGFFVMLLSPRLFALMHASHGPSSPGPSDRPTG